jgi:hypothetical protein
MKERFNYWPGMFSPVFSVNDEIVEEKRPIPFSNIIYVGDGLTDIPCFSLLTHNGGIPIAVCSKRDKWKDSYIKFVERRRVNYFEIADYSPTKKEQLGHLLESLVEKLFFDMMLKIKFWADAP